MKRPEDHAAFVKKGVALHNRFKYAEALPILERAFEIAPKCPAVLYNLANTLHMLDNKKRALSLLDRLIATPSKTLGQNCLELRDPQSFQVDAYYLIFHVILHSGSSWNKAWPFARKHLSLRRRGRKSAWKLRQIRREIRDFEKEYGNDSR